MQIAIDETTRRRKIQMDYNLEHGITPTTILKSKEAIQSLTKTPDDRKYYVEPERTSLAADPVMAYMSKPEIEKQIKQAQKSMEKAAKDLDFIIAAKFRDDLIDLNKMLLKL